MRCDHPGRRYFVHGGDIIKVLYNLVVEVSRAPSVEVIYDAALAALMSSVMPDRASVLVFDDGQVMRFRAWRGLSQAYRDAVEGHSPWAQDATNPEPVIVPDILADNMLASFHPLFRAEGLGALAFIPLVNEARLLGKFMLYYDKPHQFSADEVRLAQTIAHHVAFGLQRIGRERESSTLREQLAADFTGIMRLHDISRRFLAGGNLGELLQDILAAVTEISRASRGIIQLLDPKAESLGVVAHHGFGHESLGFFEAIAASDTAASSVAVRRRERIIVEDIHREPTSLGPMIRTALERAGIRAVQSTPLFSGTGGVLGVISTYFDAPHRPSDGDLRLIDLFSRQAADLVEHTQAERRREELLAGEQTARAEAEAASRAKDDFIAMVSHELRTPLTAMLGWTRLLRAGRLDSTSAGHALEVIERNLRHQTQILTDLLDVSRIVSGKLTLDVQLIDLAPIVEMALDIVRPAAEAKRQILTVTLDAFAGTVAGDATRLQQVFWNLISNAVKFTPDGGRIDVRLERSDRHVRVSVVDTGRGISPEFLPNVFQRFQQAETGTTRQHGGLGLGLAIVRHLVDLHGGHVQAFSAGEGKGASFVVELPLASPSSGCAESVQQRPTRETSPALKTVRVLIVDDHEDTADFLAAALRQYGASVSVATSVPAALRVLTESPPDVLVSDVSMPGEDGCSLMHRIQTQLVTAPRLVAIALTAHARAEDRDQALAAGFQMYLSKPIEPSRLGYVIQALVNGGPGRPDGPPSPLL